MRPEDHNSIEQLLKVMQQLRDPDNGCAWDVKQNFETIAPYTLEEAYEVVDAIERGDLNDLKDELGDLLLQVVFHAQMASEQAAFDFNDVAAAIVEKMIRRHPHVFGDVEYGSEAEQKAAWDKHKAAERLVKAKRLTQAEVDNTQGDNYCSAMDGIAQNLPALVRAAKVQTRAARIGFDWPSIDPVWEKLTEEEAELREAMQTGDEAAVQEEMGDLLFTVVNLARHAGVDAETALRQANQKFDKRFRLVEQFAEDDGQSLADLDLDSLDNLWDRSKRSS